MRLANGTSYSSYAYNVETSNNIVEDTWFTKDDVVADNSGTNDLDSILKNDINDYSVGKIDTGNVLTNLTNETKDLTGVTSSYNKKQK